MPRKHIILIFLVFVLLFLGIYFIPQFLSPKNQSTDSIGEIYHSSPGKGKQYKDGKILFQQCAACHAIQMDLTGPALTGVTERGPWTNRKNIYDFLKNPMKFRTSDKYMQELRKNTLLHTLHI